MATTITITYTETGHVISTADETKTLQLARNWFDHMLGQHTRKSLPFAVMLGEVLRQYDQTKHIGWLPVMQYILDEITEMETGIDSANPANSQGELFNPMDYQDPPIG